MDIINKSVVLVFDEVKSRHAKIRLEDVLVCVCVCVSMFVRERERKNCLDVCMH